MATATQTTWHLKGRVVVACNCDYGCPCNFNALPSRGHCEGGWTWQVDTGHLGDVSLDGLSFSLLCDWPAAIHDGNGEAMMLIDDRADQQQQDTIVRFLHGEIGGPWAILVNTFSNYHGPHIVPYEIDLTSDRSSVRAGEVLELQTEPIRNPVTKAEVHPRAVLPEGMVFKDGALLASSIFKVKDGVSYDHSGQYAALSEFEYSGT